MNPFWNHPPFCAIGEMLLDKPHISEVPSPGAEALPHLSAIQAAVAAETQRCVRLLQEFANPDEACRHFKANGISAPTEAVAREVLRSLAESLTDAFLDPECIPPERKTT